MADFSALPLFTDAVMADTAHLSDEEFGAYMRLLIITWRTPGCKIPNDHEWIRRRVGKPVDIYERVHKKLLEEFFKTSGNHLYQKRLLKEYEYTKSKSEKQSVRAKSRWNKDKDTSHGNAAPHQSGNAPTPTPLTHTHLKNPPTPQGGGVFENDFKKEDYDIKPLLSEVAIGLVRKQNRGWDIDNLIKVYNEGVHNGTREPPSYPSAAFPAWCLLYTQGRAA